MGDPNECSLAAYRSRSIFLWTALCVDLPVPEKHRPYSVPALIAFGAGTVFHLVSIVELWVSTGHLPLNNFYETSSLCAFLIAVFFLVAYSQYQIAVFSVCLFPLVFFMTVIGATEFPVEKWSEQARNRWLVVHIGSVMIGYAALFFSAVAAVYYLLQERQLKRKSVIPAANKLPPLGTIDRIISQSNERRVRFYYHRHGQRRHLGLYRKRHQVD